MSRSDVLVDADWVEQHLADDGVKMPGAGVTDHGAHPRRGPQIRAPGIHPQTAKLIGAEVGCPVDHRARRECCSDAADRRDHTVDQHTFLTACDEVTRMPATQLLLVRRNSFPMGARVSMMPKRNRITTAPT